jgi:hypothetical protein
MERVISDGSSDPAVWLDRFLERVREDMA